MKLPGIYFSGATEERLIVVDDEHDSYVILNATVMSSSEIENIIQWCHDRDNRYYNAGIVRFTNRAQLLQFILEWG